MCTVRQDAGGEEGILRGRSSQVLIAHLLSVIGADSCVCACVWILGLHLLVLVHLPFSVDKDCCKRDCDFRATVDAVEMSRKTAEPLRPQARHRDRGRAAPVQMGARRTVFSNWDCFFTSSIVNDESLDLSKDRNIITQW